MVSFDAIAAEIEFMHRCCWSANDILSLKPIVVDIIWFFHVDARKAHCRATYAQQFGDFAEPSCR